MQSKKQMYEREEKRQANNLTAGILRQPIFREQRELQQYLGTQGSRHGKECVTDKTNVLPGKKQKTIILQTQTHITTNDPVAYFLVATALPRGPPGQEGREEVNH